MEDKELTPEQQPAEETTEAAAPDKEKKAPKGKTAKIAALEEEIKRLQEELSSQHDAYLRLAAEYDNFRKRTQKEKDSSYTNGKSDAVAKLLPIYDNLERALQQPTEDAAYKKGVELTMAELMKILSAMGIEVFGTAGDGFDPQLHNAVMHTEDESLGENTISQVFQRGFRLGEKIIRFAMVQVAN